MAGNERINRIFRLLNETRRVIDRAGNRAPGAPPPEPEVEIVSARLSSVRMTAVEWLWPGRVAVGKYCLLCGDPGLGKSIVALDLMARLTTGRPCPEGGAAREPASVVLLSAEDDAADTIRPRFAAAGGDSDRMEILYGVRTRMAQTAAGRPPDQEEEDAHFPGIALEYLPPFAKEDHDQGLYPENEHIPPLAPLPPPPPTAEQIERLVSLRRDLAALDKLLDRFPAELVVIDPLTAYFSGSDTFVDAEVRGVMGPVSHFAARRKVGVLGIMHLNKNLGSSMLYRVSGSIAFIAASRVAHLVAPDPKDRARQLVLPLKSNLGPLPAGIAYRITNVPVEQPATEDQPALSLSMPRLEWDIKPLPLRATDLTASSGGASTTAPGTTAQAYLRGALAAGPVPAARLYTEAEAEGIAAVTLRRAARALRIRHYRLQKSQDPECPWMWALPEEKEA